MGFRKYHSDRCKKREEQRRYRAKKNGVQYVLAEKPVNQRFLSPSESKDGRASRRAIPDRFRQSGLLDDLDAGVVGISEAARLFGTTQANVSRYLAQHRYELEQARERLGWSPQDAPDVLSAEDFTEFRARYFPTYLTPPFQQRWVDAVVQAMDTGGQLAILGPVRHGKTDLLAHLCVWLICRRPNIRILWVAKTEEVGKAVGYVQRILENNDQLIQDFCGPGGSFKPQTKSGARWARTEFEVATRTEESKSPSMMGLGRGSTTTGRDADLIVVDDIDDHGSTLVPKARQDTRDWWTSDLAGRKMEHTAWFVIGSRQHADDIYAHLIENDEWQVIVDRAHNDEQCEGGDHKSCLLFPEIRTHRWLEKQKRTMGDVQYEKVYQNRVVTDGTLTFNHQHLLAARRTDLTYGQVPPGARTVAGLDPAAAGEQAAAMWAWSKGRLRLCGLDITPGGGIAGFVHLLDEWERDLNLRHWVVESNAQQTEWTDNEQVRTLRHARSIRIDTAHTGAAKNDPFIGPAVMASWYEQGIVELPYMTEADRVLTDRFIEQHRWYVGSHSTRAYSMKTDVVMAAWMPRNVIRLWMRGDHPSGGEIEHVSDVGGVFGESWL